MNPKQPTACVRTRFNRAGALAKAALGIICVVTGFACSVRGADGNQLFIKTCAPCHGKDGKAQTPAARKLGVKDLSQSKLGDEQLAVQIREGKQDAKAESKMPAYKEKLTDEEIRALAQFIKGFRK